LRGGQTPLIANWSNVRRMLADRQISSLLSRISNLNWKPSNPEIIRPNSSQEPARIVLITYDRLFSTPPRTSPNLDQTFAARYPGRRHLAEADEPA